MVPLAKQASPVAATSLIEDELDFTYSDHMDSNLE